MAIYYVDPSAPTNGTGTLGSPFNTWPASSTLTADGDEIRFRRGTTLTVTGVSVAESSSAWRYISRNNIRIGAYSDTATGADDPTQPKPTITASRPNGSAVSILLRLNNAYTGLVVQDIVFRDCRFGNLFNCSQTSSVTWRRVECYDLLGVDESLTPGGDFFGVGGTAALDTVTLEDCVLDGCGNDAVWIQAAHIRIRRCTIRRPSLGTSTGDCIQVSGAGVQDVVVQDCTLDHSQVDSKQCFIQESSALGRVLFERNTCIGYSTANTHTLLYVDAPGEIRHNRLFASRIAIRAVNTGMIIHGNLIQVNGNGQANQGFLEIGNSAKVYNNTIVNPAGAATDNRRAAIYDVLSDSDTTDKRNNLIIGFTQGIRHNPGGTETDNVFFDVTTPITNRQTSVTITPNASDLVGVSPKVSAAYRPLVDSPLIAAGTYLGPYQDVAGKTFQNPPSIGAYEYIRPRTVRTTFNPRT